MTVPASTDESRNSSGQEPQRLSQRWAIIIAISIAIGFVTSNPAAGIGAGLAAAAVLHMIMS
jgi:hypothetical protein